MGDVRLVLKEYIVDGKKMYSVIDKHSIAILDSKKKIIVQVKRDISPNYLAGLALRPGMKPIERRAPKLARHILEKERP